MQQGSSRDAVEDFETWLRAGGRPQSTIDLRIYQLGRVSRELGDLHALTTAQLVDWVASKGWATSTLRSYRAALTTYYRWAHRTGHITTDPTVGLPTIGGPHGAPRPADERTVTQAILRATPRVQLMIRLQASAGLRRAEVARVHTRDILTDPGGHSLHVTGKGGRERIVPLTRDLAARLRESPEGWLFPSSTHPGHLSARYVGKLISDALGPGVVPHQLRHRFATRAYAAGQDLLAVQQLLGHARPETTMIYTHVPTEAKRHIVNTAA
jgi:integrase